MIPTDGRSYYRYLLQRSRLAALYRCYYLYPRISRYLDGVVLDIGSGIGDFLSFRRQTIGVDVNQYTVAHCRRLGLPACLVGGFEYPFCDEAFDGAVLDNVLEHLSDPARLLAEAHRVVREGGVFLVGVPGPVGYAADPDHKRYYDEVSLVDSVEPAGFRHRHTLHIPLPRMLLGHRLRQYCVYAVFQRDSHHEALIPRSERFSSRLPASEASGVSTGRGSSA